MAPNMDYRTENSNSNRIQPNSANTVVDFVAVLGVGDRPEIPQNRPFLETGRSPQLTRISELSVLNRWVKYG